MSKIKAAIMGVAGFVPEDLLTNEDLEKMVDTNDEWIRSRTGIVRRHILKDPEKATSDMGASALKTLLKKTGLKAEEIELIICATVTADYPFPDTANIIAHKVGAVNSFGYDINAACCGFIFSVITASKFIESGTYKKVVVVGADKMSSIVDYEDRSTCILFGDAAGAILLEPADEGYGIQGAVLKADGSATEFLQMKGGGSRHPASIETVNNKWHYCYQEGRVVFKAAIQGMVDSIRQVVEEAELSMDDIDWIIPHQANKRILLSVAKQLNFPTEKVMINIEEYGNTTAATIPLCMRDFEDKLKKGDKVILTAFGGGFTWGAILLTWAYDGKAFYSKD